MNFPKSVRETRREARRNDLRIAFRAPVELFEPGETMRSALPTTFGQMYDVSREGVGTMLKDAPPIGSTWSVWILTSHETHLCRKATVMWTQPFGTQHRVGLSFDSAENGVNGS